jgi:hypothetical protein
VATCTRDPAHVYPDHNAQCPWCAQAAAAAPGPPFGPASAATQQVALPPVHVPAPRPAAQRSAPPGVSAQPGGPAQPGVAAQPGAPMRVAAQAAARAAAQNRVARRRLLRAADRKSVV